MAMRILKCTINGKPVEVGYDPRESLLDTLRDRLHLTGTKRGCEVGECGACTVLIDGVATDSCATQFHPEKSAQAGARLLRNWANVL